MLNVVKYYWLGKLTEAQRLAAETGAVHIVWCNGDEVMIARATHHDLHTTKQSPRRRAGGILIEPPGRYLHRKWPTPTPQELLDSI